MVSIVNQQSDDLIAARAGSQRIQQEPALLPGIQMFRRQFQAGAQIVEDVGKIKAGVGQQDKADVISLHHAAAQQECLADTSLSG